MGKIAKKRPQGETRPQMPGMGPLPGGKWNLGNRKPFGGQSNRAGRLIRPCMLLSYRRFESWGFSQNQLDTTEQVLLALKEDAERRMVDLLLKKLVLMLQIHALNLRVLTWG